MRVLSPFAPRFSTIRTGSALLGALALGACADRPVVQPDLAQQAAVGQRLTCAADVRAGQVSCGSAAGANTSLTLGGQGTYIQLTAKSSSYSAGTSTFTADIVLQNLTAQLLGTPDSTTVTGIKAFIASGPTVTSGTGTVTVANADGTGTFTAANQSFFFYNEILDVFGGVSSAKSWKFNVPSTVNFFTFTVLVSAPMPEESSILRWTVERGMSDQNNAIYASDSRNVFGCSTTGTASRYDGTTWRTIGGRQAINSVTAFGFSPNDVWCAGTSTVTTGAGGLAHYDGRRWTVYEVTGTGQVNGMWGAASNDVWATTSTGGILHWNGTAWTNGKAAVTGEFLWGIRGTSATDIWAVGRNPDGIAYHYNGTSWTRVTAADVPGVTIRGVAPISATDVWVVTDGGNIRRTTDGGANWSAVTSPTVRNLFSIWAVAANDIYAAGDSGTVVHYDGTSWTTMSTPFKHMLKQVTASAANQVWVTGWNPATDGVPSRFDGTQWHVPGDLRGVAMRGISGTSATDIWAVGSNFTILRNNGQGWSLAGNPTGQGLTAVWAQAASNVWFAGFGGALARFDGTSTVNVTPFTSRVFRGIHSTGTTSAFAVGDSGLLARFDGSNWSTSASPFGTGYAGVFSFSPTNAWAVGLANTGATGNCINCVASNPIAHWDGTSWTQATFTSPVTKGLLAIWGASANDIWAAGLDGTLVHYDGTAWSPVTSPSPVADWTAIWGSSANDVWIASGGGRLAHWNGTKWTLIETGAPGIFGLWGTSSTQLWAVGNFGYIARASR